MAPTILPYGRMWPGRMAEAYPERRFVRSIKTNLRESSGIGSWDYSQMQFADVLPVLEKLRADGIRMAIASSSPHRIIRLVVEQQNWGNYFSVLVSGDDFQRSKPDPEIYRYTMKQLGTAPEETLVVEDSTYGIEAGKAAGVMVAARRDLRFGFHQEKADCLFDDMREILPKISDKYV